MSTAPPYEGPTVSAERLRRELAEEPAPPVVLDVRWHLGPPAGRAKPGGDAPSGEDEYDEGHIPGAVFVDLDTELAGRPGPAGRHPLPDPGDLQDTLRRAGVDRDSRVVVYDGGGAGGGMAAARCWWVLRWAGLPAGRVAVLDGGFPAWVAAGGEVTAASGGARPPGDVTVTGGGMPVLDAGEAAALAGRDAATLLDGRAPERFRGEVEPRDPVGGHVPGAVNLPAASLVDAAGCWRSPSELAAELGPVATTPAVGAYCGSGVSATMIVLAVERAGLRGPEDPAGLYVGSWSHWCAAKRPVQTGPAGSPPRSAG